PNEAAFVFPDTFQTPAFLAASDFKADDVLNCAGAEENVASKKAKLRQLRPDLFGCTCRPKQRHGCMADFTCRRKRLGPQRAAFAGLEARQPIKEQFSLAFEALVVIADRGKGDNVIVPERECLNGFGLLRFCLFKD